MYLKNALISILLLITTSAFSQIKIDDVGDGWKSKVDSALVLIEKTSPEHWEQVKNSCGHITFWIGEFSTTVDSNTVMISRRDINLNSINNLACVIVHESHHLYIQQHEIVLSPVSEELESYLWEYEFVKLLPSPEDWLVKHVIKCIVKYKEDLEK